MILFGIYIGRNIVKRIKIIKNFYFVGENHLIIYSISYKFIDVKFQRYSVC